MPIPRTVPPAKQMRKVEMPIVPLINLLIRKGYITTVAHLRDVRSDLNQAKVIMHLEIDGPADPAAPYLMEVDWARIFDSA